MTANEFEVAVSQIGWTRKGRKFTHPEVARPVRLLTNFHFDRFRFIPDYDGTYLRMIYALQKTRKKE